MTDKEFTSYIQNGDAMLDLLCFSSAMDDLLLAADEGRLSRAAVAADPDTSARLTNIRAEGGRLLAMLEYLNPIPGAQE